MLPGVCLSVSGPDAPPVADHGFGPVGMVALVRGVVVQVVPAFAVVQGWRGGSRGAVRGRGRCRGFAQQDDVGEVHHAAQQIEGVLALSLYVGGHWSRWSGGSRAMAASVWPLPSPCSSSRMRASGVSSSAGPVAPASGWGVVLVSGKSIA